MRREPAKLRRFPTFSRTWTRRRTFCSKSTFPVVRRRWMFRETSTQMSRNAPKRSTVLRLESDWSFFSMTWTCRRWDFLLILTSSVFQAVYRLQSRAQVYTYCLKIYLKICHKIILRQKLRCCKMTWHILGWILRKYAYLWIPIGPSCLKTSKG